MSERTVDTLTQRLDRLERENHRLKLVGAVLLLALVAVGAMGQALPRAVPKVVEAERFVLRDTRGKSMAVLGSFAGGPALYLYDQNEKPRVVLNVLPDGMSGLLLADQNGKGRLLLDVKADGKPALLLLDQNEKAGVWLTVDTSGPKLLLLDEDSKIRAVLGHTALEARTTGTVEQRSASSLVLFDKDGKMIWKTP